MAWTAILKTENNRPAKYLGFDTQAEAEAHVAEFLEDFPDAFAVDGPPNPIDDWLIGPDNSVIISPIDRRPEIRARTQLPKLKFIQAAIAGGFFSKAEAVQAARGTLPNSWRALVVSAGLDQDDVDISWAAAATIERSNPLLEAVALNRNGGDTAAATAELDTLFNIT